MDLYGGFSLKLILMIYIHSFLDKRILLTLRNGISRDEFTEMEAKKKKPVIRW